MLRKIKFISIIIATVACLSGCGVANTIMGKGYKNVINDYIDSYSTLEEEDVIDILDMLPEDYKDSVLEKAEEQLGALDESEFAEYIEKYGSSLQSILNTEDAKFDYEIEDEEELVTVELRNFEDEYGIETLDAVVRVEVNVYEKEDDSNNIEMELTLLQIDGDWYLFDIGALLCEGFSL